MNEGSGVLAFFVVIILIVAFACAITSIGSTGIATSRGLGAQLEKAQADRINSSAEATRAATAYENRQREYDIQVRATAAAKEAEARISQIEADKQAEVQRIQVQARAEISQTQAQALAAVQVAAAAGTAKSQMWYGTGWAVAIGVIVLAIAGGLFAIGFGMGQGINQVARARYVQIGVERSTLLPPPLVISVDGYLIDTRSGARAQLKDAAGVDRLRLAATTQSTNLALLGRAAADIGKSNRGKQSGGTQAADVLPGIGASVPLLRDSKSDE